MKTYHLTAYNTDEFEFFVFHYTNAEQRDEQLRLEILDASFHRDLEIPSDIDANKCPISKLLEWYEAQDVECKWHFTSYEHDPANGNLLHAAHEGPQPTTEETDQ